MNARPPDAADEDDDLVDARLRAALRHAPDGSAAPPEALRRAVLQAARASLPPKPTLWQRLFGVGPTMPRAWAAAAGIGAVGLALNFAWHLHTEAPSPEFGPVASKSAERSAAQAPTPVQDNQAAPTGTLSMPPAEPSPPPKPARRDAAGAPLLRQQPLQEPTVVATAPVPAPAPAAPPAPPAAYAPPPAPVGEIDSEAKKKSLAKEERAVSERAAQAGSGFADKALADERRAVPAIAPSPSAAPPADSARSEDLAAAAKPAAPPPVESTARARQAAPTGVAPAAAQATPALPSRWPPPLARMQAALSQAEDWPSGWQLQGWAEIAVPRRAWWLAMLAGTAGRWQEVREPVPATLEKDPTWHVSGDHGTHFKLTVAADGQTWLQSEGAVWRAPWSTLPGPLLR